MPLGQVSVVGGGEATFRGVPLGSYSVEVEASGYANARGNATLPMTGEVHVEIYLRPESTSEPMVLPEPGIPVLAPKAKKELDAGLEALRKKITGRRRNIWRRQSRWLRCIRMCFICWEASQPG